MNKNMDEDIIECMNTIYKVDIKTNYRCPYCNESYYMEKSNECTAVYCPPIYKDGVNINPDRNKITTHCTCMNCGKDFSFVR